jgi:hypothetical protein
MEFAIKEAPPVEKPTPTPNVQPPPTNRKNRVAIAAALFDDDLFSFHSKDAINSLISWTKQSHILILSSKRQLPHEMHQVIREGFNLPPKTMHSGIHGQDECFDRIAFQ